MIDNEKEAHELIEALTQHLPMRAYATPPLVKAVREHGADIAVDDVVQIDTVLYLGDVGGIACSIGLQGGKTVVMASITHLRIASDHPLATRIQAYQARRSQRLESSQGRRSSKSRTGPATKLKRQNKRVLPNVTPKKNDLLPLFQAACASWQAGEYKRAADSFRSLFNFDLQDPYFCRYWLASSMFQLGAYDELDKLLERQDDQSGIWRFAQALVAFQLHGDTEDAQRLLVEADHREPGFERYLLRDGVVDASRAVRFDAGDAERAFGCARLFLPAWRGVPGAISWARQVLKVPPITDADNVPRRFPRDELRALPLRREAWQVGLASQGAHKKQEPMWLFAVANVTGQEMRVMTVIDQPPTETVVWNQMIEAFLRPMEGTPSRPSILAVGRRDFHDAWKSLLAEIGIQCHYENDLQPVGHLLKAMGREIRKRDLPAAEDIDIRAYPQSEAIWQADFIRSPAWVMNEQEGAYRPWTVLVLEKSRSIALTTAHTPGDPTPEMLLEFLVRTMARPDGASAQRPRLVEVADSDCYDYLRPRLEAAGVACRLVDELREFNDFCVRLARTFDGPEKCALADGKGVKHAHMESFYEAAAYYFRTAPWRNVPGEIPIEIRCDDPALGTRFAIVLGRTGVQLGLCVCDDWKAVHAILGGYATPDENRALVVCYDEAQIMSAVDLQLIDRFGWSIATPEAWPAVMRLKPHHTPRSASAGELVFLDACLRAIPDFIMANTTSHARKVETGTQPVLLHLAWSSTKRA